MSITLRDIDNRDADGAPYEVTTDVESVIGYLDGPLRSDVVADSHADLDEAIEHVRAGRIDVANGLLRSMAIYLTDLENRSQP